MLHPDKSDNTFGIRFLFSSSITIAFIDVRIECGYSLSTSVI